MSIKICLAGASGHVGSELVQAIIEEDDLKLTAAVGRTTAGLNLGSVLGIEEIDIPIRASVEESLPTGWDVLVDYTTPAAVKGNVKSAINGGRHAVVGTSGLTDEDYHGINQSALAQAVGVMAAGNFSITATLMQHFALVAARHVPTWEILDYAPDTKPDAPSGTARELAFQLGRVAQPDWAVPVEETKGLKDSRGAELNGSQIHSIRIPGFYSSAEVMFGLPGERLSLRHDSMSYQPYVAGTLLAIRKVETFTGLRRGLAAIMDLG
jgi:4-hydroxy-tetrahydrodipicolinate reductase